MLIFTYTHIHKNTKLLNYDRVYFRVESSILILFFVSCIFKYSLESIPTQFHMQPKAIKQQHCRATVTAYTKLFWLLKKRIFDEAPKELPLTIAQLTHIYSEKYIVIQKNK